jgi:hypothetical protein
MNLLPFPGRKKSRSFDDILRLHMLIFVRFGGVLPRYSHGAALRYGCGMLFALSSGCGLQLGCGVQIDSCLPWVIKKSRDMYHAMVSLLVPRYRIW